MKTLTSMQRMGLNPFLSFPFGYHCFFYFYRPQTKLREGIIFTPVYHSVHRRRVLCPGKSLSGGFSVQGGLCPGGPLSRGFSLQGFSVQGISVQGVTVQGGLCSEGVSVWGGLCLGGSLLGRPPRQRLSPPYGNKRVVCILLECIIFGKCKRRR